MDSTGESCQVQRSYLNWCLLCAALRARAASTHLSSSPTPSPIAPVSVCWNADLGAHSLWQCAARPASISTGPRVAIARICRQRACGEQPRSTVASLLLLLTRPALTPLPCARPDCACVDSATQQNLASPSWQCTADLVTQSAPLSMVIVSLGASQQPQMTLPFTFPVTQVRSLCLVLPLVACGCRHAWSLTACDVAPGPIPSLADCLLVSRSRCRCGCSTTARVS
jgi:hypothetical protein